MLNWWECWAIITTVYFLPSILMGFANKERFGNTAEVNLYGGIIPVVWIWLFCQSVTEVYRRFRNE